MALNPDPEIFFNKTQETLLVHIGAPSVPLSHFIPGRYAEWVSKLSIEHNDEWEWL